MMNRTLRMLVITSCLPALAACQPPAPEDYANRGDPERLLTATTEIVHIDLGTVGAIDMLAEHVDRERPSRAILNCMADKSGCKKARNLLNKVAIATENTGSGNDVTLVYERVAARDCEQRFIDNSSNVYNLNAPSYGCSISGNIAQMVTDKRQFTSPKLLGYSDGEKAGQVYENYSKPTAASSSEGGSATSSSSSIIGSGSSSGSQ